MTERDCRAELRQSLARAFAAAGLPDADMVVSTAPPLVSAPPGEWEPIGCRCPHGVTYWIEPTGEQRARWAAEGAL